MREADASFLKLLLEVLQGTVTTLISFTAGQSLGALMTNKIRLNKISKYEGNPIKECTFINSIPPLERTENQQKMLAELLPFVEKLLNYTEEGNLKTMYANLNSLKLKKKLFSFADGEYNPKTNTIKYFLKSSLGHEILHLSSSYYDAEAKMHYVGFEQKNDRFVIGRALNEGYTELLASRIYNKDNKIEAYKFETRIAELIELFFDNPKEMEKFYFNHDLLGFVKYMERFMTSKELVQFLIEMDSAHLRSGQIAFNPFALYENVKIQLKLYELFKKSNIDDERLNRFEDIICKNKVIRLVLNKSKMKVYKENPYTTNKQSLEDEHKKNF